jgi:hypothetical protein
MDMLVLRLSWLVGEDRGAEWPYPGTSGMKNGISDVSR